MDDLFPADTGSFNFVPIALSNYVSEQHDDLSAEAEAAALGTMLADFGGWFDEWAVPEEQRSLDPTMARLNTWSKPVEVRNSLLLWLGHGRSNDDEAVLIVGDTTGSLDHELTPQQIAKAIVDEHRHRKGSPCWAIVVIEACGAARFVEFIGSELLLGRAFEGVLLIGSGASQGRGYLGSFRRALTQLWKRYLSNDTVIGLGDFAVDLGQALGPNGNVIARSYHDYAPLRPSPQQIAPIATTVDTYAELQAVLSSLPDHERLHFAPKGTGANLGELGWHFAGRTAERQAIADWLVGQEHGLLVVTGPAGIGKSAILGNILLCVRPEIGAILNRVGLLDEVDLQPLNIDLSLLLAGARAFEVAEQFAELTGVDLGKVSGHGSDRTARLLTGIRERSFRVTVLADSLDEAQEPVAVAALFRELAALPGMRIVIGTRPRVHWRGIDESLLDELGRGTNHVEILSVRQDTAAIADYVIRRLSSEPFFSTALGPGHEALIRAAAEQIAHEGLAERDFLRARLIVREVLTDHRLLQPESSAMFAQLLGMGHSELFDFAVATMSVELPVVDDFLRALAFALGRGFPRRSGLWVTAANAIRSGERELSQDDLDSVLKIAGPYVMLDADNGQTVYRLTHRSFADRYLSDPNAVEWGKRIAAALLAAAREQCAANPYLRRHLTSHAITHDLGLWDELGRQPGLLDLLDLDAVVADARNTTGGLNTLHENVIATIVSAHLDHPTDRPSRRALRTWGRARVAGSSVSDAGDPLVAPVAMSWDIDWARLQPHHPHLTLAHNGAVRALVVLSGASDLLVSGGDDGLRVWDTRNASLVHSTNSTSLQDEIVALAADEREAQVLVVGAKTSPQVMPIGGESRSTLPFHRAGMEQVAASFISNGSSRFITGGVNGELNLWSPQSGEPVGTPVKAHSGAVTAIAVHQGPGDVVLVATAGRDRVVRLWSVVHGQLVRTDAHQHTAVIRALTISAGPDGDVVVLGDDSGLVASWSAGIAEVRPFGPDRHNGSVTALTSLDGGLVASGGQDKAVRLWDVGTTASVGPMMVGHRDVITSLAAYGGVDGKPRLASGSRDGTVRLWESIPQSRRLPASLPAWPITALAGVGLDGAELAVTTQDGVVQVFDWTSGELREVVAEEPSAPARGSLELAHPDGGFVRLLGSSGVIAARLPNETTVITGYVDRLHSAALVRCEGGLALAVADHDATVRLWSLSTGHQLGQPLRGHGDWIPAMAAVRVAGRELLITGSDDRTARVWDPDTSDCLLVLHLGVKATALATLGEQVAIGSSDGLLVVRITSPREQES